MTKRKLGNFKIIKISSTRLKRQNYKLDISYEDAIRNGEIIKIGQNNLCESIQKILKKDIAFDKVENLETQKRRVSKRRNSDTNREELRTINKEIQELTFIPELVAIFFKDKRHYGNILNNGLFINGIEYVRAMASAGNLRNNTVFFVVKNVSKELKDLLDVGRNKDVLLIPSKLAAYQGLNSTASHPVSFPSFVVIPDYKFNRFAKMSWINEDSSVETVNKKILINPFDGQGLISPQLSEKWASELGLNYIPSTMIIRSPYIKGQVSTFDFVKLANELGVIEGTDIWGNTFVISEQQLILSASQFKMGSESWESMDDYIIQIESRRFGFRISRISPKESKRDTTSNYMTLQVLSLADDEIDSLVYDTVSYFQDIRLENHLQTSLYLAGGNGFPHDFDEEKFQDLDTITKAILAYPSLLHESYISQRIKGVMKKKETQAKLGKLLLKGNYSPLVADVYAQGEWLCGIKEPKGLLKESESYSFFWNNEEGVKNVACCRSPLTHHGELMEHTLADTAKMREWFQYQETSYIFNAHGLDSIKAADADKDGDIVLSTDNAAILKGRISGLPISYTTGTAEKMVVSEKDLQEVDVNGFGSRIGHITNLSSFYHALKHTFEENSKEYIEIDRRLKIFRKLQGSAIDAVKYGADSVIIPSNWIQYDKTLSPLDKKLLADRRPQFFIYNYSNYMKTYKDEIRKYNIYSHSHFGRSFQDILDDELRSIEEQKTVDNYFRFSFFIFTPSTMNRISWKMEEELDEIDFAIKTKKFDYRSLFSKSNFVEDTVIMKKLEKLYIKYRSVKVAWRKIKNKSIKKDVYYIMSTLRKDAEEKISSNRVELANNAVQLMMDNSKMRAFAWDVFGDVIIENLLDRYGHHITVLTPDYYGKEEFLYQKYSKKRIFV